MTRHLEKLEGLKGLEYIKRNPGKVTAVNTMGIGYFRCIDGVVEHSRDDGVWRPAPTDYCIFNPRGCHYIWEPPAKDDSLAKHNKPYELTEEGMLEEWKASKGNVASFVHSIAILLLCECDRRYQPKEEES